MIWEVPISGVRFRFRQQPHRLSPSSGTAAAVSKYVSFLILVFFDSSIYLLVCVVVGLCVVPGLCVVVGLLVRLLFTNSSPLLLPTTKKQWLPQRDSYNA